MLCWENEVDQRSMTVVTIQHTLSIFLSFDLRYLEVNVSN